MKVHSTGMKFENDEAIKVEKKFRLSGMMARTIYGDSKEELINKVKSGEVFGIDILQEYKGGRWVTIGKFVIK
jgi:hypothetical protein